MVEPHASEGWEATRFHLVLVEPQGYSHARSLHEIAALLLLAMEDLRIPCSVRPNQFLEGAVNIVLGYHFLADPTQLAEREVVLFQLEQLSDREGHFGPGTEHLLRSARGVLDYSQRNVEFLLAHGIARVAWLPLGYHQGLQTIQRVSPDIDILFCGSLNERREAILNALRPHCRVESLFDVYGPARDALYARARIHLNVHFYDAQVCEQARLFYLLTNRGFVLSETSIDDPYEGNVLTLPYDGLVDGCLEYLQKPSERYAWAKRGQEFLRSRPMASLLARALTSLGFHVPAPTGGGA